MMSTQSTQIVGWASSLILVLTIGKQVWKQWRERSTGGVSKWLFIGQCVASAGFIAYSLLTHALVFVVTNSLMLTSGVLGYLVFALNRRRSKDG